MEAKILATEARLRALTKKELQVEGVESEIYELTEVEKNEIALDFLHKNLALIEQIQLSEI